MSEPMRPMSEAPRGVPILVKISSAGIGSANKSCWGLVRLAMAVPGSVDTWDIHPGHIRRRSSELEGWWPLPTVVEAA